LADLAVPTERVRSHVIRWLSLNRLLEAAADMLSWENSGVSIDASVRITLIDHDVPVVFRASSVSCGTVPTHALRSTSSP
jgi:hypothetical protein